MRSILYLRSFITLFFIVLFLENSYIMSMKKTTFKQFQETRSFVSDLGALSGQEEEKGVAAFLYDHPRIALNIQIVDDAKFWICIDNGDWLFDTLNEAEKFLYKQMF